MIVTGLLAYWILRSIWWERQCYTTARPLTPYSISGRYLCYNSKWMLYFHSWKSFNVTHLMNHMINQFSALSDPFPSLAATAASLQLCLTLCHPIDGSPPSCPRPWDSPGKNTGVGCHFLLQRMKVKSESEVTQSCPTLRDPIDRSLPGSSIHGIFQVRVLEWGAIAFSSP